MIFIWPLMLLCLLVLPIFVALYLRAVQQRRKRVANIGSLGLVQEMGRPLGWRRHIPPALYLLGLTMMTLALARPQATLSLPRLEGIVMLTFDVSGSMAAGDMQPTRMEAAKTAARDFVNRQPPSVQLGVVAFSDSGLAIQIPTNDKAAILTTINRLTPTLGTSLANGIVTSIHAIEIAQQGEKTNYYVQTKPDQQPTPVPTPTPLPKGTFTSATIVLLSDGENNQNPNPMEAAQLAVDRGIRIHTVGVGSPQGITLKVNGFSVFTKLDEGALQDISKLTEGDYYNAQSADDLRAIYQNLDTQLVVRPDNTEVTALFAGISIIALLVGGALSLLWFGRVP